MFFINSQKNFFRGFGYTVCVLLVVLCGVLAAASFAFGARGTVDVFGFNIYIAQTDEFESVSEGSAVFVKRCEPYDIEEGNLILYYSDELTPALGYTDDVRMVDGAYVITVSDGSGSHEIPREAFVGRADSSSAFIGGFIRFARTPAGVLVMAVLPCAALVLYDIIRARRAQLPPPEVEPVYKNVDEDKPTSITGISVKPDGNAEYSRKANVNAAADKSAADKVLFTYAGKQHSPAPKKPDIIPLTDRTAAPEAKPKDVPIKLTEPTANVTSASNAANNARTQSDRLPVYPDRKQEKKPAEASAAVGKTPSSVAARRYLDNAAQSVSTATAELPEFPKKTKSDSFFTQSDVPQIGRQKPANRALIDLEDALSSARHEGDEASRHGETPRQEHPVRQREYSGKKSAAMIAGMGSELFTEDDDSRDRGRYEVDDILAGLEKRRKQ